MHTGFEGLKNTTKNTLKTHYEKNPNQQTKKSPKTQYSDSFQKKIDM